MERGLNIGTIRKIHLTQAANSEGVRYRFTYNDKGQPIRMTADGGKHLGAVIPGRVYYIRGKKFLENYLDVKGGEANNAVTAQLYTFNGSAAQKWKLIDGKDGYMQFEPLVALDTAWILITNLMQKEKRSRSMETTIPMHRNGSCIQTQMEVSRSPARQRKIRKH